MDAPVLLFKSLYPNDYSKDKKSSDVYPKRGKIGLVFPESSSLPGRFFLGLSEEVCPEAQWLAESLSMKESKIYKFHSRLQLHVSIAKAIHNIL